MKILDAIEDGTLDNRLDAIITAAIARRQLLRQRRARELEAELQEGDRVIITQGIKPKYLVGCAGTIIPAGSQKQRAGYTWVNLDKQMGRFSKQVFVPITCLQKVTA